MSRHRYILKRVAFSLFAIYLVMSITFGFIVLTGNPIVERVRYEAAHSAAAFNADSEEERTAIVNTAVERYKEAHNIDDPVLQRYLRWLGNISTLDWGDSFSQNEPVTTVLGRAIPTTLAWVLPAMAVALVGGIGLGVYSALSTETALARIVTGGSYLGFGIPNYWLANVAMIVGVVGVSQDAQSPGLLQTVVLPAVVLSTTLLTGQLRYAKATSRDVAHRDFVTLLRAKGASTIDVARHILRNAAVPLLSLFFTDLVGIVIINVFVLEQVLGIPGIGHVGLTAIQQRDLPLVLGVALTLAFATIGGNLIQDLAATELDPRIDVE